MRRARLCFFGVPVRQQYIINAARARDITARRRAVMVRRPSPCADETTKRCRRRRRIYKVPPSSCPARDATGKHGRDLHKGKIKFKCFYKRLQLQLWRRSSMRSEIFRNISLDGFRASDDSAICHGMCCACFMRTCELHVILPKKNKQPKRPHSRTHRHTHWTRHWVRFYVRYCIGMRITVSDAVSLFWHIRMRDSVLIKRSPQKMRALDSMIIIMVHLRHMDYVWWILCDMRILRRYVSDIDDS